jgi:serine O-acetyltransferase
MKCQWSENLPELIEPILENYAENTATHRIGHSALPSHGRIVALTGEIRRVLFPGFHSDERLDMQSVRYRLGDLLNRIGRELCEQINHCFHAARDCQDLPEDECTAKAGRITREFLARIPELRRMLALDAEAAYDGDPAARSIDEIVYCYPGFYAVTVYRIAHELFELEVPLMPRIISEHAHSLTGTDIHPGARIGKRFFIDHATGVVIGETSEIGDNVKIYQGVTLGAKSFPKDERGRAIKGLKRHPTIEDNVTIYANATILGGDTIVGRGVTIAGNTFVTESISADSLVVGEAPKLNVRSKKKR